MRHFSIRTEGASHDWVERFVRFHGIKHLDAMADVNAFLTHLAVVLAIVLMVGFLLSLAAPRPGVFTSSTAAVPDGALWALNPQERLALDAREVPRARLLSST